MWDAQKTQYFNALCFRHSDGIIQIHDPEIELFVTGGIL